MNTYQENPQYLKDAVLSYMNQRNVNVQLIISTVEGDPSIKFVPKEFPEEKWQNGSTIEFCIEKKGDAFSRFNKATELLKGEWFCYATSYDVAVITKLETEIRVCKKAKKAVCYSSYAITNDRLKHIKPTTFHQFSYQKLLKKNFISSSSLVRADVLRQFLPFSTEFRTCEFWDLWLRVYLRLGNVFVYSKDMSFLRRMTQINRDAIDQAVRTKMIKDCLKIRPIFKRVTVKVTDPCRRELAGRYLLQDTPHPTWKKATFILHRKPNGSFLIKKDRKTVATDKTRGVRALWELCVTDATQL